MTTFDRTEWLAARTSRAAARPTGPTLGEQLSIDRLFLIRIRCRWRRNFTPYHDVLGFAEDFGQIPLEAAVQADLVVWAREQFPAVNWLHDHQVWLAYGCVHAAPDANEDGFLPETDATFGGSPAVLLERQAVTA